MSAAFFQQVKQTLADAKRDYAKGSTELADAERAYANIGSDPNEVKASTPLPAIQEEEAVVVKVKYTEEELKSMLTSVEQEIQKLVSEETAVNDGATHIEEADETDDVEVDDEKRDDNV